MRLREIKGHDEYLNYLYKKIRERIKQEVNAKSNHQEIFYYPYDYLSIVIQVFFKEELEKLKEFFSDDNIEEIKRIILDNIANDMLFYWLSMPDGDEVFIGYSSHAPLDNLFKHLDEILKESIFLDLEKRLIRQNRKYMESQLGQDFITMRVPPKIMKFKEIENREKINKVIDRVITDILGEGNFKRKDSWNIVEVHKDGRTGEIIIDVRKNKE